MKNNLTVDHSPLRQTNVVYCFQCPHPHSQVEKYYGMTQSTLSHRLTAHGQGGSIYQHFHDEHQRKPTRRELTENTTIIAKADNRQTLAIKEALLILNHSPSINKQFENFSNILKIHLNRNSINYLRPNHSRSETNNTCIESSTTNIFKIPIENQIGNIQLDDNSIPDMNFILSYFGIEVNKLCEIPLNSYKWNSFVSTTNNSENYENNVIDLSPTISQRIRGLVREARYSNSKRH